MGGLVWGLREDLQLAARAEVGGLYGYDGDGGKVLARGGLTLRWLPGASAPWFDL